MDQGRWLRLPPSIRIKIRSYETTSASINILAQSGEISTLCLYRAGYGFKRLFTISEYYDRDRQAFYRAIQSVRESEMDMTGWLEYFVDGLATQMREVTRRGEWVIRHDVLAKEHDLSERQSLALGYILEHGNLAIQDYNQLCPGVNRRTLQRDLKSYGGERLADGAGHQLHRPHEAI